MLIFQTCNNYAGYVCIESYFGDEIENDADTQRRIVAFHIYNTNFNNLEAASEDVEIMFTSALNLICEDAIKANQSKENKKLQDIIDPKPPVPYNEDEGERFFSKYHCGVLLKKLDL